MQLNGTVDIVLENYIGFGGLNPGFGTCPFKTVEGWRGAAPLQLQ